MDNKIVNASEFLNPEIKTQVKAVRALIEEAEKQYRDTKSATINRVVNYLKENPDVTVTVVDIAEATGIPKTYIRDALLSQHWNGSLERTMVSVTRRFAQVDENGELIPNGRTLKQKISMTGYTAKRIRRSW